MKRVGIIPADKLPSSSIGLRIMEFKRLNFDKIIAYTSVRASLVRQSDGVDIAKTPKELVDLASSAGNDSVVFVNGRFKMDSDAIRVFGTPADDEILCLTGQLINDTMKLGDKSLLRVMEYDRRRSVQRYTADDSGDMDVSAADSRSPIVMSLPMFSKMMSNGDAWMETIGPFLEAASDSCAHVVCLDPERRGIRWNGGVVAGRKKPTSVVVRGFHDSTPKAVPKAEPNNGRAPGLVVSMSTYRKRFPVLEESLGSILSQTVKPDKVCVVVDDVDIPYIPEFLRRMEEDGKVEILTGSRDLGPHNKYIHAMTKYPSHAIVTFDDDARYRPDALEELYMTYRKYPRCVVARRAHLIRYDENGVPLPYKQWVNQCTDVMYPSFDLFATGVGGVLYPPGVFEWSPGLIESMKKFRNDDLFMKKIENDLGVKVVVTGTKKDADPRIKRDGAQDNALLNFNVNGGNNDVETAILGICRIDESPVSDGPFFRIVTPVYKSSRTLERAIRSIASQTFDDYVSVVCDDGSPQEYYDRNRELVGSLGKNGIFLHNETNLYAGAARNKCLSEARNSAYTLFLDADDKFSYDGLFKDLHDFIIDNGYPDLVLLPSFRRNGTSTRNIVHNRIKTIEQVAADRRFEVPWCKCIKSNLVQPFQEGLRRCNDVLQHFLTVDVVSTVAAFYKEAVTYCADSDTTMFGSYGSSNRRQKPAITSYLMCAKALIEHEWVHSYTAYAAASEVEFIIRHSMPQFLYGLGPFGLARMIAGE